MEIIKNSNEFNSIKSLIPLVINSEMELPDQIFVKAKYFLFVEFLDVSTKGFYNSIVELKQTDYLFYSIVPDPEEYYFRYFSKYSVFKFNFRNSSKDYLKLLHEKPKENSADAIMDVVDKFVVFSTDLDVVVYGDRDFDLMILGFEELCKKVEFVNKFGENRIFSFNDIQDLFLSKYPSQLDLIEKIGLNYFDTDNSS